MPAWLRRAGLVALAISALADTAAAQPYDAPPPYGYGYARPRPVRGLGLNCATRTPGTLFAPPAPFMCPLRRSQPLGTLCVCRAPAQYGREDWEGTVVP
jgi:hypothetical protein